MYDGIISGNERNGVMSTITRSDDTINLYGGTITGNTGAGIAATHWPMPSIATSDYYTNINLYGGTISENTGAGIDAAYGRVTMAQQSSAIPVEIKNNKGGAISLTRDGSTANLGTGLITGNSGGKGAVALSAGSLTLTGDVKITGNTGANLYRRSALPRRVRRSPLCSPRPTARITPAALPRTPRATASAITPRSSSSCKPRPIP